MTQLRHRAYLGAIAGVCKDRQSQSVGRTAEILAEVSRGGEVRQHCNGHSHKA